MLRTFQRALLAALFVGLGTAASQAALIIGFRFADDNTTNKVVPPTGGVYTVNIVASTDNASTTNIAVNAGYLGALSSVLNGSTIGGNITGTTMIAGLSNDASTLKLGSLQDNNADGRVDMGFVNGTAKSTNGWMRPNTGGTNAVLLGGPTGVIGTFTVTIPANTSVGTDFLRFLPQIDPSGVGNDWSWTENNLATPLLSGAAGSTVVNGGGTTNNVIAGTSITFSTPVPIPEPSTFALGGVLALGFAGYGLRRKKQA